jgi:2-polyprenyl-3-methyl-5-hydroxy-6-metoxy-1,4-benzoquinol methylase
VRFLPILIGHNEGISLLREYFRSLYQDAMMRAYSTAYQHIASSVTADSAVLDCGANNGWTFDLISRRCELARHQYTGIEWNAHCVEEGKNRGLNITRGDLNIGIPHENAKYSCVYALSVLEHLLNPCRFLKDCYRVLRPGGQLVILTPNISTYFTVALILVGKMPSSGPHPDSDQLLKAEEIFKVSSESLNPDTESGTPVHRHLVVFSYRVLRQYLQMIGFSTVRGRGFGVYPFPRFAQPLLERLDPYHCHQMVFVATKVPSDARQPLPADVPVSAAEAGRYKA